MTGLFASPSAFVSTARYIAQESVATRVLFFASLTFWAGPSNFILVLGALALYSFWIQDPVVNEWGQIASLLSATPGPGSEHVQIALAWKSRVFNKCGSTASLVKQVEDEDEVQSTIDDLQTGAGEPREENVSLQDEADIRSPAEAPAAALSEQPVEQPGQTPEPSAVEDEAEKVVPKPEASQGPVPPPITPFGQPMPGSVQEQAFSRPRNQQPLRAPRTRSQMFKGVRPTIKLNSVLRKGSLAARKHNTPASDSISIAEVDEADALTDSATATLGSEDTPNAPVSDEFSIPGAYEADSPTNEEPRPESPPAITESSKPKDKDPQVLPSESPKKLSVPSHRVAEELRVVKTDVGALPRSKSTKVEVADSLLPQTVSAETPVKAVSHKLTHFVDTATTTVSAETSVKAVPHKVECLVDTATSTVSAESSVKAVSDKLECFVDTITPTVSDEPSGKAVSPKLECFIDTATPTVSAKISDKAVSHKLNYLGDIAPIVPHPAPKLKSILVDPSTRGTKRSLSASTTNPTFRPAKRVTFAGETSEHPAFAIMRIEGLNPLDAVNPRSKIVPHYVPDPSYTQGPTRDITLVPNLPVSFPNEFWTQGPESTSGHDLQCGLHAICQTLADKDRYTKGLYASLKCALKDTCASFEATMAAIVDVEWTDQNYTPDQLANVLRPLGYHLWVILQKAPGGKVSVIDCSEEGNEPIYLYLYKVPGQKTGHYENISSRGRKFVHAGQSPLQQPHSITWQRDPPVTSLAPAVNSALVGLDVLESQRNFGATDSPEIIRAIGPSQSQVQPTCAVNGEEDTDMGNDTPHGDHADRMEMDTSDAKNTAMNARKSDLHPPSDQNPAFSSTSSLSQTRQAVSTPTLVHVPFRRLQTWSLHILNPQVDSGRIESDSEAAWSGSSNSEAMDIDAPSGDTHMPDAY